MAQLTKAFDSGQHDDMNDGFDPIPAGDYKAVIAESEIKETSKKTGKYIEFKFGIIEGEFKGRFIWTRMNIVNPSDVAVEIGQKELATLCRACNKPVIADTQELHGIPIVMKVKIKPAKGDYPAGNEPTGYKSLGKKVTKPGSKTEQPIDKAGKAAEEMNTSEPEDDTEVPWGDD